MSFWTLMQRNYHNSADMTFAEGENGKKVLLCQIEFLGTNKPN